MVLTCIRPPLQEPVSIDQVKNFLKIDDQGEDLFLITIIKAARQFVEDFIGQSLLKQQWKLEVSRPPNNHTPLLSLLYPSTKLQGVYLSRTPVIKVKKVHIQLETGGLKSLLKQDYYWENSPPRLILNPLVCGKICKIVVEYSTGYGKRPQDVPPVFLHAVLMKCAELYENRGDQPENPNLLGATERFLKHYKEVRFGLNHLSFF